MHLKFDPEPDIDPDSSNVYAWIERGPDFRRAKRSLNRFVRLATIFFLAWYGLYVVLGMFASDLMATPVFGTINIGLLLGLAQFISTFIITGLYVRFTNRKLAVLVAQVRVTDEGTAS
ncbi:DUF485 domain-containing protein [Amycolatopsis nivea]|uniref:DUF485 domain-containing protein n=1 Tax=Amycolatopsis nivea TaxID=1644109 RepID=UPI00106F83AA|nr:DUF485 domain-containing protein [Amycolatopsis nivea]